MKKTNKYILIFISFIFFAGCSSEYKKEIMKEELKKDINTSKVSKREAIKIVKVNAENFHITRAKVPNTEKIKRVKILGAKLDDVIALLTEATDQNIIFQLQPDTVEDMINRYENKYENSNNVNRVSKINNNGNYNEDDTYNEDQIRESKVFISASNIGFGKLLKKSVGDKLSIRYNDDTYYIGYLKTVTLKIPSINGLAEQLKKTLTSIGAVSVVSDTITSSVTFSAREKEYEDIMKYLKILRNNLYVIEYDIAIYNVELKDNYNLGIDWNLLTNSKNALGITSSSTSNFGTVGAKNTPTSFGAIFSGANLNGQIVAEALSHFGKVESIQRPKLLGIAGTNVTLTDGLEEPYIKEIKTTTVGDSGIQTSTVSASALSGIKVTLNSNILDGTILTDISLDINDIISYTSFEVDKTTYSQPKVQTKNIKSSMRVQPGVPIVISGLFKNKSDKGYKGIPGLDKTGARLLGGSEYTSKTKTEMVIIVTPRVIKYVMK